jgi:hypothetical protein
MAKSAKLYEAKVKDDSRLPAVTAFGGREYVKGQWRLVPAEQPLPDGEHPYLEWREAGTTAAKTQAAEPEAAEVAPEPAPKADRRGGL